MTQRHPGHGATERTGQSPWHSDTHTRRPAAIPMAQRRTRHTRDTPDAHRHSLPLRSTAQRRKRDTPDVACRCVPRKVRSKLTSANPRIPCACYDRPTGARTRDLLHRATKTSDFSDRARFTAPATRIYRPVLSRAHQCIRTPTPATRNAGRSA